MSLMNRNRARAARTGPAALLGAVLLALIATLAVSGSAGAAATTTIQLGSAGSFAVLAGSTVTNVPTSSITGDVGLTPAAGSFIIALGCVEVTGTIYKTDATGPGCATADPGVLTTAMNASTAAYVDGAGRSPDLILGAADNQLGSQALVPGVYRFGHATTANLTGNLTLNGDASAVWIFQATSDLVTASGSTVTLTGGAQACNVFWTVVSSATLGTGSTIRGTVLAQTSITATSGTTIEGRLQAQSAAVTLDHTTIAKPGCVGVLPPGSTPPGSTPSRSLYCDPAGKAWDLLTGEDKLPPYDTKQLVDAYVDPVTGSKSCTFPLAVTTTAATTTTATTTTDTTTTTATTTTPTTTTRAARAAAAARVAARRAAAVKAATAVRVARAKRLAAGGASSTQVGNARRARRRSGFTG